MKWNLNALKLNKVNFNLNRWSLKQRFYATTLIGLVVVSTLASLAVPTIVDLFLRQNTIAQLDLVHEELLANIEWDDEGLLLLTGNVSDPRYQQPYSGFYWRAAAGEQVLRSRSLWDTDITFDRNDYDGKREVDDDLFIKDDHSLFGANREHLMYSERTIYLVGDSTPVSVIVGVDETPHETTVLKISGSIMVIFVLVVVCLCALLIVQMSWALRPLRKLQNSVKDLEQGSSEKVEGDYPSEIRPLVDDLNALLYHYQALLERSRHHAGNLSHALKTPLTVLKQDAMKLDSDNSKAILDGIAQLQSQIEYHLAQARVAGAKNILAVEANPCEIADSLTMAFDKVYQHREILLVNELVDEWRLAVDEQDLGEMLGNVIENAYKWAKFQVVVSGKASNGTLHITIDDDGPGVSDEQLSELTVRGRRFDEQTPGTGLGLSIVKVAVESYSGDISFARSPMGGLQVNIALPLK